MQVKRLKAMISKQVGGLTCPLTFELIAEPAMAEDGRTYERLSIERATQTQEGANRNKDDSNAPFCPASPFGPSCRVKYLAVNRAAADKPRSSSRAVK